MQNDDVISTAPLAHPLAEAGRISGVSRVTLYREHRAGRLPFRKVGRRTVVLDQDLRAWLSALPAA